jgi:hypothetical protein
LREGLGDLVDIGLDTGFLETSLLRLGKFSDVAVQRILLSADRVSYFHITSRHIIW